MVRNIISLVFLVAAIMVFFTWAKPTFDSTKELRSQESDFNAALASSKEVRTMREGILTSYNAITQENFDRLNKFIPSKMEAIKLVIEIENVVQKYNLLLKNIDVQKPVENKKNAFGQEKKNFEEVALNISVVGSYESFVAFLDNLEKSLNLLDITELTFGSGNVNSYDFNIKALTYWKK